MLRTYANVDGLTFLAIDMGGAHQGLSISKHETPVCNPTGEKVHCGRPNESGHKLVRWAVV